MKVPIGFIKELERAFLMTMPDPIFWSMPVDTEEDRERLAAALNAHAKQSARTAPKESI